MIEGKKELLYLKRSKNTIKFLFINVLYYNTQTRPPGALGSYP